VTEAELEPAASDAPPVPVFHIHFNPPKPEAFVYMRLDDVTGCLPLEQVASFKADYPRAIVIA
jgi:hypothetical protein